MIFNPMAVTVQWISLTCEQFFFLYRSVRGVLYDLIIVLGKFSVIVQLCNFCGVGFTYTSGARRGPSRESRENFDCFGGGDACCFSRN